MNKNYFLLFFLSIYINVYTQTQTTVDLLRTHVYTLAHDSMRGRDAGSNEGLIASQYIEQQFREIGIKPFNDTSFFQNFLIHKNTKCRNVIGIIEGNDLLLKDEYIIIGAHYDHVGQKVINGQQVVYNGADDNASGTAALIELARALKQNEGQFKRSIILVAFDAEEKGLLGSKYLSTQLPLNKIKLMVSIDMIGWYKQSKKLYIRGFAMLDNGKKLIQSIPLPEGLTIELKDFERSLLGATDTEYFAKEKVPAFHVTTGLKSPYHKPEDDPELIDYEGLALITEYMTHLTETFAKKETVASSGKLSPKHENSVRPVQVGVLLNVGSNALSYSKTAFNSGKSGFAFAGGFFMQFNTRHYISIRPEVLYENKTALFPSSKLYNSKPIKFNVQSITVPLSILLNANFEPGYYFYIGVGGYYSYNFHAKMNGARMDFPADINHHEGGIQTVLGLNMQKITINATFRNGLSPAFINVTKATNSSAYFSIGYAF